MESSIQDYRTIDGVNIAHSGKTSVSLFRYGDNAENHSRTRLEEVWSIEEVDFNIKGLSMDCFLPPADLQKDGEGYTNVIHSSAKSTVKTQDPRKFGNTKFGTAEVAAIDEDDEDDSESSDGSEGL